MKEEKLNHHLIQSSNIENKVNHDIKILTSPKKKIVFPSMNRYRISTSSNNSNRADTKKSYNYNTISQDSMSNMSNIKTTKLLNSYKSQSQL